MSRRNFLKATAAGALAFSAVPTIIIPRRVEAYQPGGRLHPNISPLRVAGLQDPAMTTAEMIGSNWQQQEQVVAWEAVQANMDSLACALAEERAADDAWKKILIKPAGKAWSDVVVAIKTNNIAEQHTRSAVLSKVCHVLIDTLGVKASNIHVYDACHGGSIIRKSPFARLPEGVTVEEKWGGSNVETTIPVPYFDGQRKAACLGHLVRGDVDILINIAMCKGHGGQFGRFTMTMKNHFGTFNPRPGHGEGPADYLIGLNKSPEILGAMDPRTGDVLFPRQQLCIIDGLWASDRGPGGNPSAQPNFLAMGTCGPVVDYMTAMRFRKDTMGWSVNEQVAERFLTEFGFSASNLPNGGQLIGVPA
jgi:hypothetical protein